MTPLPALAAQVKLEEGSNSIQVRMLFGDLLKRLSPKDWTSWSEPLDPPPIGPSTIHLRQDRLSEYLNPSNAAREARATAQERQTAHLSSQLQNVKAAHSTGVQSAKASAQTPRTSVAAVMQANESKTAHSQKEAKGPPAEVKQRFGTTRQSPFVLTPSADDSKDGVLTLNLGENVLYHDPEDTGPTAQFCTVYAYLKRLLISTTHEDTVVLISDGEGKALPDSGPLGFKSNQDTSERTTLVPSQQYSAQLGDRILFLDTGVEYTVGRQVVQRMPARIRIQTAGQQGEEGVVAQRQLGIELYLTIASDFKQYVPQSLVQRAQFQLLFCEDVAVSLGIDPKAVEFISCHPVTVPTALGTYRNMTQVIFLLLPGDHADSRHEYRNQHLGPRVLAAELAALVADPDSDLHRCVTLRNAHGLKFKIGSRLAPHGTSAMHAHDQADGSSTASTLSEPDPLSDEALSEDEDEDRPGKAARPGTAPPMVVPSGAAHPLRTVEGRLATFGGWSMTAGGAIRSGRGTRPETLALSPLALASAGFYRIEDPDSQHTVRCAYCRVELQNLLEKHAHPDKLHKSASPNCPMVLGTVTEQVGIVFRDTAAAHDGDGAESHDDEEEAEGKVNPEQEDLAAMAHRMGAGVPAGRGGRGGGNPAAANATAAARPQAEHEDAADEPLPEAAPQAARGPSRAVRDRVYRQLEKQARRAGRSSSTPQDKDEVGQGGGAEEGGERRQGRRAAKERKLRFKEIQEIFQTLDKNGDGSISHAEFITGLKKNAWVADKLGMPSHIRQEDGSRESYQLCFGKIDNDNSKSIEFKELCAFFGYHDDGDLISDWSESSHSPAATASASASEAPPASERSSPRPSPFQPSSPPTPASREHARHGSRRKPSAPKVKALPAITYTSAPKLTALELINIFKTLDLNGDGEVSHAEFVKGLRKNPTIAEKLGMPTDIRAEDGTRESYQLAFGQIDNNDSKSIDLTELLEFYGHLDLEKDKLHGLLMLCGYDEDAIQIIYGRAGLLSEQLSEHSASVSTSARTPRSYFSGMASQHSIYSTSLYSHDGAASEEGAGGVGSMGGGSSPAAAAPDGVGYRDPQVRAALVLARLY